MRKLICMFLSLMLLSISACSFGKPKATEANQTKNEAAEPAEKIESKVGIIIGANAQSEELFTIQKLKERYGNAIETAVCPNDVEQNRDALASCALSIARTGVEAMVFVHAVPGTAAAIDKVREQYPYMLIICGSADEEPSHIASKADIVLNTDEDGLGGAIIKQAAKMGAKTFVLYTFPREMADKTLSRRRDSFSSTCAELGIQFVDATVPDPMSETGVEDARQFIKDDVPRMVDGHGRDTAFYSSSCELQETLIKLIIQEGALYPQQCHLSPFHVYPDAFGIEIPSENDGDASYMLEQIRNAVAVSGGKGRFSAWPASMDAFFAEIGTEYAMEYLDGTIIERNDIKALQQICSKLTGGSEVTTLEYEIPGIGKIDNYYLILLENVNF